ncbi:glutamine--tRNA ligase-like [Portunus trituberculatus]|uniref:glutamine--tRNA ligase-like n=1 Tax=Portunus trituberculatus TaxID=210409 RepID=UPI001E1CEBEB|nr:glutamine--tRNA ligase-like [Portunus trituberculatus]
MDMFHRVTSLIGGFVQRITERRRGRRLDPDESSGSGAISERVSLHSGGEESIRYEDAATGGGVVQEHGYQVLLEDSRPTKSSASAGNEESLLLHGATCSTTNRSSVSAIPDVDLDYEGLYGATALSLSTERLSYSTATLMSNLRDSDEETIYTDMDSDAEREEQDSDIGYFQQGTFSLSPRQLQASRAYAGMVRTRFAPEPNGPLHLGHARAIHMNFSVARRYGGQCILRLDDTNPRTAQQVYCDEALEMVRWLGYSPASVSYTSDYFDDLLMMCACRLILNGSAYVCHEQLREGIYYQGARYSPWRNRSPSENMKEFKMMCVGLYREGEAVLRLKARTRSGLRDPVAYRICNTEHYRSGTCWCVFPTYVFSHSIIDSQEGIAVSLCSTEFAGHRSIYQWIQKKLNMHKVPQREFHRLEVGGCILSKRQLLASLGTSFHTYDDPRLATLTGLRRRGIPPEAIRRFVREGYREYEQLLDLSREMLLVQAKHCMVVLQPLACHVVNYDQVAASESMPGQVLLTLQAQESKAGHNRLGHHVTLSSVIYINKYDFNLRESRHYFTPTSPVRLRGTCYAMHFCSMMRGNGNEVASLQVRLRKVEGKVKSMKVLTWVSEPVPVTLNFLDSPRRGKSYPYSSLPPVYSITALMEAGPVSGLRLGRYFTYGQTLQAERFAYITLDPSSSSSSSSPSSSSSHSDDDPVFNVTCMLRLHQSLQDSIVQVFQSSESSPTHSLEALALS